MPKTKVHPRKNAADRGHFPKAAKPVDVDEFDEPYEHAKNDAAVLCQLAEAKAQTETHQSDLWFGLHAMAERLLKNLEQMNNEYTSAANHIFALEHREDKKAGVR